MSASWQADPTGRHQVRWWDGQNWTDHVADDGVTSLDPFAAAPAAPAAPAEPAAPATGQGTVVFSAQPAAPTTSATAGPSSVPATPAAPASSPAGTPAYLAGGVSPSAPVASAPAKKFPILPVVGGVVVAVVLILVLVFVIGGGGDDGPSTIVADIRDEELLGIRVSGDQGGVVVVEASTTDDDLDLVLGMLIARDDLRDFYDVLYEIDSSIGSFRDLEESLQPADDFDLGDFEDDFRDGYVFQEHDNALGGDRERAWMVIPVDGSVAVVAFPYDLFGSGEVELSVERCGDVIDLEDLIFAEDSDEEFDLAQKACGDIRVPFNS